jgi:DNA mismatch endonuclease (patch repair protein)
MMSGIRGKNTKPELLIRKALHARGFRYRLHCDLPGKPDICLPKHRAVIFVHGCFWHGHGCHLFKWPSTRPEFWKAKIERNCEVDRAAEARLIDLGWRVAIVWECALKGRGRMPLSETVDQLSAWLTGSNIPDSAWAGAQENTFVPTLVNLSISGPNIDSGR